MRLFAHEAGSHGTFLVATGPADLPPATAAAQAYALIGDALRPGGLEIVQERIFAGLAAEASVVAARRETLSARQIRCEGPYNYLQGAAARGEGFGGVIVRAIAPRLTADGVRDVCEAGVPRGRTWRIGNTACTILQNIQGLNEGSDNRPGQQARRAIEKADRLLRSNGADYRAAARTWFYLSDILQWYGEFNAARTAVYNDFGLLPRAGEEHILPASTGIRADVPTGAACSLELLAVSGETGSVRFLRNPAQKEAFRYGSAFSRCAVLQGAEGSLVEVSGTAAIDEKGKSLHAGDVRAQVRCTLDKLSFLMSQVGAGLRDMHAATVFVKQPAHVDAVRETIAEAGFENLPAVYVLADVCREELLFEMDGEAFIPAG
jgi:enamine deaminase RidA (YjgF/YER057c/UK114 family)